jgi:hypothetical protein
LLSASFRKYGNVCGAANHGRSRLSAGSFNRRGSTLLL